MPSLSPRSSLLTAIFALLIPATTKPLDALPLHGTSPGRTCNTASTDQFVGKLGSKAMGVAIKHASRALIVRWVEPGMMLTMEFRIDRVNVYLDEHRRILKITCG